MGFGDNLKTLRKQIGMTTTQCAAEIGVTQPAWNQWELGLREPKFEKLKEICRLLGCSADWLLGLPSRGGSVTARGDGAIAAAGSNIHIEVGKDDKPGEMKVCANCPKVAALQETFATILQAARTAAAKSPRKK